MAGKNLMRMKDRLRLAKLGLLLVVLLTACGQSGNSSQPGVPGGLTVNIVGLPEGVSGSVLVTGPDDFSSTLSSTSTLHALAPGMYDVVAQIRMHEGNSFVPQSVTQTVNVNAATTAVAQVEYGLDSTVVSDRTRVVNGDAVEWVTESASSVSLSIGAGAADALKVGDLLVVTPGGPLQFGLLGEVTAVTAAGTTEVTVSYATLDQLIEEGSFVVEGRLTFDELVSSQPLLDGVSAPMSRASLGGLAPAAPVEYGNSVCYQLGNVDVAGIASVTGETCFDFSFKFDAAPGWTGLRSASFIVNATESANLTVSATAAGSVSKRQAFDVLTFAPITIFVAGVPIPIVPQLTVYVGVDGSLSTGWSMGVNQSVTYVAGLIYENRAWRTVNDLTTDLNYKSPRFEATANLRAYAGADLNLRVLGE